MAIDISTKAPGVHIDEITPTGPIVGQGTSVVAMIGQVAGSAPANIARSITNWTEFATLFGRAVAGKPNDPFDESRALHLPFAVRGFFDNGGTFLYIVPIAKDPDEAAMKAALNALSPLGDVSVVCAPGITDSAVQQTVIKHCEAMQDRFAILDGVETADLTKDDNELYKQRTALSSVSGFAALYWPWIITTNSKLKPDDSPTRSSPPSGHIAGIYVRSDGRRGVHKAPANEQIGGALGLSFLLDNDRQKELNNRNINALRIFPNRPPTVWGARTLTGNDDLPWRYVNVRRLLCYIEDSLVAGLRWAVFEPNNTTLWKGLERTITEFLTRVWEAGALFGATAEEAFYVRIDKELNPDSRRAQGVVTIEIGVAPVRPAEFVIVTIGQWDGGARITED